MPTALIADDEEAPRAHLIAALRETWQELRVVAECTNGVDAWDAYLESEAQVCFLDVRMPGLTGIEVAQRIGAQADIVFVTTAGDHALAAFDAAEVAYVLKPIDAARLADVVAGVRARLDTPGSAPADLQQLLNRLVGQVRKPAPLEEIQTGVAKEARLVRVDDVVYFESDLRATRVVCPGPDSADLYLRTPLKELLAQLDPARFWQIQRSVIVNRRFIDQAVRTGDGRMLVRLHERPEKLPVAPHFQGLFQAP